MVVNIKQKHTHNYTAIYNIYTNKIKIDTPERLKQYTETLGGQWLFLTEELDIMREIWDTFHVYVEKEGALVGHSNLTYLIDELGLVQVRYSGLPPTSAFAADIRKLQEQSS